MRIALFGKRFDNNFRESMCSLLDILNRNGVHLVVYKPFLEFLGSNCRITLPGCDTFESPLESGSVDVVLSIGGDGTFLETVTFVRDSAIPVLGINSGRLGFLADTSQSEIEKSLQDLFLGNYRIEHLDLLCMESCVPIDGVNFALNEVAITKRDSSSMITIHTYLNDEFLNSYWADGLIVATPTGSTAYSLSVGGPVMHPGSPNFIITAIAPHNLNVRPLVVPNDVVIDLHIEGRGKKILASLDSRNFVYANNCRLRIKKAAFRINVIRFFGCSFYATLRNKLMWGADKRN
ncbi:MAG: NAD kinase [Breznakibacter sp.]